MKEGKMTKKIKEQGACEMILKLENGTISVEHCEGGNLANWKAEKGDWNKIWITLNKLVKKNNGFSLSLKETERRKNAKLDRERS